MQCPGSSKFQYLDMGLHWKILKNVRVRKYNTIIHMNMCMHQNSLSRLTTKMCMNCKQIESLTNAIIGGYRTSST